MLMNKILLVTLTVFTAVTLFACVPGLSSKNEVGDVVKTASQIADFSLPSGYAPEFAGKVGNYTAVSYNPGDGHSHLYLIQSKDAKDSKELSKMLTSLLPGSIDRHAR